MVKTSGWPKVDNDSRASLVVDPTKISRKHTDIVHVHRFHSDMVPHKIT